MAADPSVNSRSARLLPVIPSAHEARPPRPPRRRVRAIRWKYRQLTRGNGSRGSSDKCVSAHRATDYGNPDTWSFENRVVQRARAAVEAMGKSLNQLVREYLASRAASDDAESDIAEMRELSKASGGRSRSWKFDRDELHARS